MVMEERTTRGARVESVAQEQQFRDFMLEAEPRLRRALVAAYGGDRGRDATAEALAYGWEHWSSVRRMQNPVGYLFRVGQSRTRPRRRRALADRPPVDEVWCEPGLPSALAALTEQQRIAVVLHHGYGWSLVEVAELLRIRKSSVQNHVERGMRVLRERLEGTTHARP
jgi:DNA-directed RNA polymerase specialized sigma24 family protein